MPDFTPMRQPAHRAVTPRAGRFEMRAAIVAALQQAEGQGDAQTAAELLTILTTMPDKAVRAGRAF